MWHKFPEHLLVPEQCTFVQRLINIKLLEVQPGVIYAFKKGAKGIVAQARQMPLNVNLFSSERKMIWEGSVIRQPEFMIDASTNLLIRLLQSAQNQFSGFSSSSVVISCDSSSNFKRFRTVSCCQTILTVKSKLKKGLYQSSRRQVN